MTAPVEEVDLPPFTNMRAVCARCACRVRAYVMFDRDCTRARGDHFHRRCVVCGHEWLERCSELEAEVTVPVAVACAAVGIDPAALASVVRRLRNGNECVES